MKSLLPYYGGKQRMASRIVSLLPRHTVYVEPFCGGAAVMLAKPWPPAANNNHYREVLNDVDEHIVNLYRVVQREDTFREFRRLVDVPYSRREYGWAKELTKGYEHPRGPGHEDATMAAAYWIAVKQSFGYMFAGGWGMSVYGLNHAATNAKTVASLDRYLQRLSGVYLECTDAIECIARWDSPQTLFYCDPPYPGAEPHYRHKYTQEQFDGLCEALRSCTGSFVLSGYDNPAVDPSWERFEFKAHCSASGQGKTGKNRDKTRAATSEEQGDRERTEVVWRVDRSDNARPELQAVWRRWAARGFRWGGDKRQYGGQMPLFGKGQP